MSNLIQTAKNQIDELVRAAYDRAAAAGSLPAGAELTGSVEIPKDSGHGDYACSYALAAAKTMHMPPRKIADALMAQLDLSGSCFESVEIAGAGFLNFRLSTRWYADVIKEVEAEGKNYGSIDVGHGRRWMVEFVSANPTGTMTIGNARGGVVGDVMASILQRAGFDVWREFYVNDAGHQVEMFAQSVEARYIQLIKGEDAVAFPENGYHGEDIKALAKLFYEEHSEKYLDVPEAQRRQDMMTFGIEHNIKSMHDDLLRYGIKYDLWFRESELHKSGYVQETVQMLIDGGYTYEKDGALWFKVSDLGAEKDEVLKRSDGSWTYFAVDMAYHRNKFVARGFEKTIDVWGADHHGHAIRFKKGITALNIDPEKLDFILMQLVRLVRDGETVKVSKRTGKAITLNDLLDEISCDAARFFFNAKPDTHLDFDMDLAVRQDSENPVYYVQYAHARICSVVAALAAEGQSVPAAADVDYSLLDTEQDKELIKQISQLPEEIRLASRDFDPSRINRYLVELAARFHRFYNANRIKGEPENILRARLKLADSARSVIAICLDILGVSAPEKM